MLHTAMAVSDDIYFEDALEKVIDECIDKIGAITPQVGIVLTSCMDGDFPAMLRKITDAFPTIELIGCTTDGEITRQSGFIEDSIALLLLASDTATFGAAIAENISINAKESFSRARDEAQRKIGGDPVCGFMFPDGLTTTSTSLDICIREVFGEIFPIFGGTAGDHYTFKGTSQFYNTGVFHDAAPLLLLGGELKVSVSVRKGPVPTGPHYRVNRYEKNVVYEIDDKNALDFYHENMGGYKKQFALFPLAVYQEGSNEYYLRNPYVFDERNRLIRFVGNFPDKCTIRLTQVSRDYTCIAAQQANQEILDRAEQDPEILLLFACTSLRQLLGTRAGEKFALLNTQVQSPFFGFYGYGEISPQRVGLPVNYHSDSYVIVSLDSKS
ncbi:FIST signal transduction protein [Desulforhopalus singaporensis]|uniref:Uncharacterized conserved protein, contains FIST_N domain n=1 Tax=Desulforhopalus singaporensis TaxID=91360 RepID=A0A1H0RK75_9BACT|nr:FIST N-terminal domain-containing protein [Desulforhopalus singaporensis]SDP29871.1 Uncharacterized conserved protein, contains FIST_N domain [Desulforhopalus singaporensis]